MLCGNKCDLDASREVSQTDAAAYAEKEGIPFFETSAKDGINIYEAVEELIRRTPRRNGKEYKLVILGKLDFKLLYHLIYRAVLTQTSVV